MPDKTLSLQLLPQDLAICRLDPERPVPEDLKEAPFYSVTKTADEFSVVCPQSAVPEEAKVERGWKALKVEGPLDFATTGVLADLTKWLAEANISVFALSTYDTDYLLIRNTDVPAAVSALRAAGHNVTVSNYR
jgi:hypothetical protein